MCLKDWQDHTGSIPSTAYLGHDFPHSGMYAEGYAGKRKLCAVSDSGDNFWRELNIRPPHPHERPSLFVRLEQLVVQVALVVDSAAFLAVGWGHLHRARTVSPLPRPLFSSTENLLRLV